MDPADLMKAMGEIDDELIEGSERPRGRALMRILPIAAAFVLVFAAAAALMLFLGKRGEGPEHSANAPEATEAAEIPTSDPAQSDTDLYLNVVSTLPPGATEVPGWENEPIPSEKDYVRLASARELAGKADIIVRARIVDSICAYVPVDLVKDAKGRFMPVKTGESTLHTIYGIQVLEVYKGGETAESVKRVMVPGGIVEGVVQSIGYPDYAQYCRGGECVLFLNLPEESQEWIWSDMAVPMGFGEDRCDIEYDGGVGVIKCRFPEITFDWLESLSEGAV